MSAHVCPCCGGVPARAKSPRLCHLCGGPAPGDLLVTAVMPGKIARDIPCCSRCSRDVFALGAFVERLQSPSS